MKNFIFLSSEGSTYQPQSTSIDPDADNLQVVGFGSGGDEKEALTDLLRKSDHLRDMAFDEVWALEVDGGGGQHLSIRDHQKRLSPSPA
jgi:hypothetical protein